mmetsp:Transcript_129445/g.182503  ORF Transcript_129445/g.182503 Transcript_129445/m.182503 type:complete len:203 (-) Transcript_129445:49-657(-)
MAPVIYDKSPFFTMEEVAKHNQNHDGWIAVGGCVFDITEFVKTHPGWSIAGQTSTILAICRCLGTDCTEEWEAIHSRKAKAQSVDYFIGRLEGADDQSPAAQRQKSLGAGCVLVRMEGLGPQMESDYASFKLDPSSATLSKLRKLLRMVFQSRLHVAVAAEAIRILVDGRPCQEDSKTLSELGITLGEVEKLCATLLSASPV